MSKAASMFFIQSPHLVMRAMMVYLSTRECARNIIVSMIVTTVKTICLLHHRMLVLWRSVLMMLEFAV